MENNEPDVFVVAGNVYSPLGKTTAENFAHLKTGRSSVKLHQDAALSEMPLMASLFDATENIWPDEENSYTKFEQLLIASVHNALQESNINVQRERTVLIISSTKGNISLLETEANSPSLQNRISLSTSANMVAAHFGFKNKPVIISNACVSGVLGIITGMRLLKAGQYDTAVIAGADVISRFIVSGFESFRALSSEPCRPFDHLRNGLNLGEGAGTIILSNQKQYNQHTKVLGGAVSNDANHISGPSRTGQELGYAISKALKGAGKKPGEIDFISGHGTATLFNDEMEASAIVLNGLQHAPLNSLKGYYGHTLGAAGLIEAVISLQSLNEGFVLPTPGYEKSGVSGKVNVCSSFVRLKGDTFLKTASGFGGCNAAVVFGK